MAINPIHQNSDVWFQITTDSTGHVSTVTINKKRQKGLTVYFEWNQNYLNFQLSYVGNMALLKYWPDVVPFVVTPLNVIQQYTPNIISFLTNPLSNPIQNFDFSQKSKYWYLGTPQSSVLSFVPDPTPQIQFNGPVLLFPPNIASLFLYQNLEIPVETSLQTKIGIWHLSTNPNPVKPYLQLFYTDGSGDTFNCANTAALAWNFEVFTMTASKYLATVCIGEQATTQNLWVAAVVILP